jgi:hypothetical protein
MASHIKDTHHVDSAEISDTGRSLVDVELWLCPIILFVKVKGVDEKGRKSQSVWSTNQRFSLISVYNETLK